MDEKSGTRTLLATGDIILGKDPERYFRGVDSMLRTADCVFGQLETPYSDNAPELADLHRSPRNLAPLAGRFDVLSMAGNHIYDGGDPGVLDTLAWLREHNIPYVGAGANIAEAVQPVVWEGDGLRIGFLSWNCTGPAQMSAGEHKPGCAFVDIVTHYDLENVANPGGPPARIFTWPEMRSFQRMRASIEELRQRCDILCVYLHKGLVHMPVKLADYERVLSHAAIDAGADVVLSSHSHVLHGIEIYRGRTIYHGLSNFIAWVPSLQPDFRAEKGVKSDVFDPEAWAKKRLELFGFLPRPDYPTYPFHPDAIYAATAKCVIRGKRIVETRFIPMVVRSDGIPYVVGRQDGGEVLSYMEAATAGAGLNAVFHWDGDEVVIGEGKSK